jgi:hypothetical protein
MASKQEALAELDEGYQDFRRQIVGLPDSAYAEDFLGEWNLSQLLAHMSGWFREMTGAIKRVSRGERPTPEGVDYSDADKWNDDFAREAKSGARAFEDWEAAYRAYYDAAAALPEELYGVDPEKGRPRIGNRLLQTAGIDHFKEHRQHLEAWAARRGR